MDLSRTPLRLRPTLERLDQALLGDRSPTGKLLYDDLRVLVGALETPSAAPSGRSDRAG